MEGQYKIRENVLFLETLGSPLKMAFWVALQKDSIK
jgi:hypothetical protein